MSRERFETSHNLEVEGAVRQRLAEKWRCEIVSLPDHYRVDWAAFRGQTLVAFMEFKDRTNINSHTYPDIMLSLAKVEHGIRLAELTNSGFVFVVQLNDGIFTHKFLKLDPEMIRYTSRSGDPRDDQDMEPCVHIPIDQFTRAGDAIFL